MNIIDQFSGQDGTFYPDSNGYWEFIEVVGGFTTQGDGFSPPGSVWLGYTIGVGETGYTITALQYTGVDLLLDVIVTIATDSEHIRVLYTDYTFSELFPVVGGVWTFTPQNTVDSFYFYKTESYADFLVTEISTGEWEGLRWTTFRGSKEYNY